MKPDEQHRPNGISRNIWVLIGFLAVAAYFLFSEHRAHFIYYLPFVLVLACPLMHLFHGHGSHRGHADRDDVQDERRKGQPLAGRSLATKEKSQ
jgi:hypothetical protein